MTSLIACLTVTIVFELFFSTPINWEMTFVDNGYYVGVDLKDGVLYRGVCYLLFIEIIKSMSIVHYKEFFYKNLIIVQPLPGNWKILLALLCCIENWKATTIFLSRWGLTYHNIFVLTQLTCHTHFAWPRTKFLHERWFVFTPAILFKNGTVRFRINTRGIYNDNNNK